MYDFYKIFLFSNKGICWKQIFVSPFKKFDSVKKKSLCKPNAFCKRWILFSFQFCNKWTSLNDSHRFKESEWYSDSADFAVVIWSIFNFVKSKQSHPYIS